MVSKGCSADTATADVGAEGDISLTDFALRLYRLVDTILGPHYDACSVVAAAFSNIDRDLDSFSPAEIRLQVLRDLCSNLVSTPHGNVSSQPAIITNSEGSDKRVEQIEQCLRRLGSSAQMVVGLVEIVGCSLEEVSTALDLSVGAVRRQLHHGRLGMAKLLRANSPLLLEDDQAFELSDRATLG